LGCFKPALARTMAWLGSALSVARPLVLMPSGCSILCLASRTVACRRCGIWPGQTGAKRHFSSGLDARVGRGGQESIGGGATFDTARKRGLHNLCGPGRGSKTERQESTLLVCVELTTMTCASGTGHLRGPLHERMNGGSRSQVEAGKDLAGHPIDYLFDTRPWIYRT
jgi:hypothetical protein